jgi:hypothetical protein
MAALAMTRDGVAAVSLVRTERFYVRMAGVFLAVAFVGFAPTYWIPLVRGTLHIAPLAHVHALFFYGWLALFATQTWLAASGRLPRHRETGVLGVALASGMCFVGLGMAINSLKQSIADGYGDAGRAFTIVPVTAIALFAVLFAIAIVKVKKPEVHKRLMLVATASMLQAAVGRWFVLFLAPPRPAGSTSLGSPPPVAVTVMPGLLVDLLIVAAMLHDRRTRGRVHPAYWIAGAAVLAVQLLRAPLSTSGVWIAVTNVLLALAP